MYFLLGLGGMIGALLRYGVNMLLPHLVSTFVVNAVGCFLFSFISARYCNQLSFRAKIFFTTGLIGSFTTFSTFAVEFMQTDFFLVAFVYFWSSLLCEILFTYMGFVLGEHLGRKEKSDGTKEQIKG